jgi:UDP:flavonoid glycosyltransferase YjiC (YdhE family)
MGCEPPRSQAPDRTGPEKAGPDQPDKGRTRKDVGMRVAVLAGGDPGHVFPAAALTRALDRRGHDALFCTGGHWLPRLSADAVPAVAMPHPPPNPEPDAVRRLRQTSRRLAPQIAETLAGFAPDLLVSDVMTPSGALVAGLLGIPWMQLVPHPLQDPSPFLPPAGSGLPPARGPISRYRDRRLYRITEPQWEKGNAGRERDLARLGLPPGGAPIARLVASLPALEAPRPDWPRHTYLVGPLEWDPADADLPLPAGDGPLVLLSATTVTGAVTGLAQATLEGLAGTGVRVAWTVLTPPAGGLPGWVSAGPGRQEPLIEQADVVVCGGGHGILAKSLTRGTPVVTVPGGGEQKENADRIRRAGLGVAVSSWRLSAKRLRRGVERVLAEPGFADRAAACRPDPGRPSSAERAVGVVERLMS